MVHNNKVLTVSYGTFSCTLEGFEDSFGTMKAIAEYFRDLASDDRYFGAEPPQPDAEMLARIAQREVARQVEARTSSEGIHLRASAPVRAPEPVSASAPVGSVPVAPTLQPEATPAAKAPETTPIADKPVVDDTTPAVTPAVVGPIEVEPAEAAPVDVETGVRDTTTEIAEEEPVDLSSVDLFEEEVTVDLSSIDLFEDDETAPQAAEDHSSPVSSAKDIGPDPASQSAASRPVSQPVAPAASVDMATIAAISAAVAGNAPEEDSPSEEVEFFSEQELEPGDATETSHSPVRQPVHKPVPPRSTDAAPAADSIAAKLQRIRAVVAQTPQDDFSEDEHAESFVETARAELAQTEEDYDEADYEDSVSASEANDDEISRVLDRLDLTGDRTPTEPAAPIESPPVSEVTLFDDAFGADEDESSAQDQQPAPIDAAPIDSGVAEESPQEPPQTKRDMRLARRKRRETPAASAAPASAAPVSTEPDETAVEAQTETAAQRAVQPPQSPTTKPAATPQRARIVKVKRADLQKAMAAGNLEEIEEDEDQQDSAPVVESSLDAADEAELLRELAEVEADLLASNQEAASGAADRSGTNTAASPEPARAAASEPRSAPQSPDNDVSRLMAAAETKLEDPDNATSRETYSQLRAAVAAAQADRTVGGRSLDANDAEAYREDLASVVRPRRPESGSNRAPRARSSDSRPAPLKLVAEQRIDPAPKEPAQPVQPRRISVLQEDTPAEGQGSFADYARDRGAAELQDLLEAAAAYLSFVEGRDHFSRPQLMSKVRSIGHADFNRENGLRSFGQLLREGKIERANNGHFSATDDTGFRPSKRAAG
jgi:ribonuclease E